MDEPLELTTAPLNEPAMCALAEAVGEALRPPLVCYLQGDLGAGKTTFVRALLRQMGYAGRVKSPTYGLLEHYRLPAISVLHLDLYRIENAQELDFLGIADLMDDTSVLLVEWPERGKGVLPEADFTIQFEHEGQKRSLRFAATTGRGEYLLSPVRSFVNMLSS